MEKGWWASMCYERTTFSMFMYFISTMKDQTPERKTNVQWGKTLMYNLFKLNVLWVVGLLYHVTLNDNAL